MKMYFISSVLLKLLSTCKDIPNILWTVWQQEQCETRGMVEEEKLLQTFEIQERRSYFPLKVCSSHVWPFPGRGNNFKNKRDLFMLSIYRFASLEP